VTEVDLKARIEELERERAELIARTNRLVAEAQERAYWADRLKGAGVDLERIFGSPAGRAAWTAAHEVRPRIWKARLLWRRVVGKLRSML
jgi:hypothetical protein